MKVSQHVSVCFWSHDGLSLVIPASEQKFIFTGQYYQESSLVRWDW